MTIRCHATVYYICDGPGCDRQTSVSHTGDCADTVSLDLYRERNEVPPGWAQVDTISGKLWATKTRRAATLVYCSPLCRDQSDHDRIGETAWPSNT